MLAPDGPVLVLAGPGTGKTTVLAARIAYQVSVRGLAPPTILAVTFTKAAGRALRWRVGGMLGQQARELDIMTFHAFGWRVVQEWWRELGFRRERLLVYGKDDAEWLLARAAEELQLDPRQQRLPDVLRAVDDFRLTGIAAQVGPPIADLARALEALLRQRNAVDLTSMLCCHCAC